MVVPRPDANVPMPISLVFFGSPDFAVPTLDALAGDARFVVRLVVTQPPRPSGRGQHVHRSAVHEAADARGLITLAPERLRDPLVMAHFAAVAPSLFVVAAYGKILRPELLAIPDRGTLNVHASLLPAYRGASPIHAAILDGASETGVSIMLMDVGLDTGPILTQKSVHIPEDTTTAILSDSLGILGASLLVETAGQWVAGELTPSLQDERAATVTRLIKKGEGNVRWAVSAERIARMERAYRPWPGVFTFLAGKRLLLYDLHAVSSWPTVATPGTIVSIDNGRLRVRAGDGDVLIAYVQSEGRSPVAASVFARGRTNFIGGRFTMAPEDENA